jgi:hypothetical protein
MTATHPEPEPEPRAKPRRLALRPAREDPTSESGEPAPLRALERLSAQAVYGAIVVGALLAVESERRETTAQAVGATLIGLVVLWFAHAYAHTVIERVREGHTLSLRALGISLEDERGILLGAAAPITALVLTRLAGGTVHEAVLAALWVDATSIVGLELLAGLRAGLRSLDLVKQVAMGALLGVGLMSLKLALH